MMAETHTLTMRRMVGAGLRARCVEEEITVPVLGRAAFDELLAANVPSGRHDCGTAAGAPLDGLVRDEWRGRVYASRHAGHGVLVPVAVAVLGGDE